jgi:hypothetical protein
MRARAVGESVVVVVAAALVAWASRVDTEWFERRWSLDARAAWVATAVRAGAILAALASITLLRPRVGRWVARVGGLEALLACARVLLAVALAFVVAEAALRRSHAHLQHDLRGSCDDRMAEPDARLGWVWKAGFAYTAVQGFRRVSYAYDAWRARAPRPDAPVDPERPTVVLVGESIMDGHGLQWEESLPALVGAALDVQVVDLGVDGYGCDQAFVRLVDALPRLSRVVAGVTLF